MKKLSMLMLMLSLSGCAIVDQNVTETQHPDGRLEKTTSNRTWVTINAKQVIESSSLSNGKTQRIGTSGTTQESIFPIKDMADLIHELNSLKAP